MEQPVAGRRSAEGREAGEVTVPVRVAAAAAKTKESPPAVALPVHFEAPKMVSLSDMQISFLNYQAVLFCKKKNIYIIAYDAYKNDVMNYNIGDKQN